MTQEIIDKLHELEAKRGFWTSFKVALVKHRNVCVQDYSHTPYMDVAWLNNTKIDNWGEFQAYVMKYVDTMINVYDEKIAEL